MRKITLLLMIVLLVTGCAFLKQAKSDYELGKTTPIGAGETSPKDQAAQIAGIIGSIPGAQGAAPVVAGVLTFFLTWKRGQKLRRGLPTTTSPVTGVLGKLTGIEGLIQELSAVFKGAFEVGGDNSALKRAWKVGLSTSVALVGFATVNPTLQQFLLAHPSIGLAISGIAAFFGGIEKKLSTVQPIVTPATTESPSA